jgi:hypothetical protein
MQLYGYVHFSRHKDRHTIVCGDTVYAGDVSTLDTRTDNLSYGDTEILKMQLYGYVQYTRHQDRHTIVWRYSICRRYSYMDTYSTLDTRTDTLSYGDTVYVALEYSNETHTQDTLCGDII